MTQSGSIELFGPRPEQWSVDGLRRFTAELQRLWKRLALIRVAGPVAGGSTLAPIHRKDECRGVLKG